LSKVFILDTYYKPLDPVHPGWARLLLKQGKASVFRQFPFTIILKVAVEEPQVEPLRIKLDPGSQTTGLAVVNDATGDVVFAANLEHRGKEIKKRLDHRRVVRRSRRHKDFLKTKPTVLKRILAQAKVPLKDAAAVNTTRWALFEQFRATGLPIECGSGGLTKFNRTTRELPKDHWIDALCIGKSTPDVLLVENIVPLLITATGHGRRQMCVTNPRAVGFPKQHKERCKTFLGYRTGDVVKAVTPKRTIWGRIAIRHRPKFRIGKVDVHPKYMRRVHRTDGYDYEVKGVVALPPRG
jgi:hypothetical protein